MWGRLRKKDAKTVPLLDGEHADSEVQRRETAAQEPERPLGIDAMIKRLPAKLQTTALLCLEGALSPAAKSDCGCGCGAAKDRPRKKPGARKKARK